MTHAVNAHKLIMSMKLHQWQELSTSGSKNEWYAKYFFTKGETCIMNNGKYLAN